VSVPAPVRPYLPVLVARVEQPACPGADESWAG
jgi:hypothetical protein